MHDQIFVLLHYINKKIDCLNELKGILKINHESYDKLRNCKQFN